MAVETKVEQRLASGIAIRQDFKKCVRFVMFDTGVEDWRFATHAGTAFIVNRKGRPYGITCGHVRGDFEWSQLALSNTKFGNATARLKAIIFPSEPSGGAVGSDVLDIAVVEFADDVDAAFFGDSTYILDAGTVGTSREGNALLVHGNIKETTEITEDRIAPVFGALEFTDRGCRSSDLALREAAARYEKLEFGALAGISGSPVFNVTTSRLCGVVVRAGMTEADGKQDAIVHYVDMFDVLKVLDGVVDGSLRATYTKVVARAAVTRLD